MVWGYDIKGIRMGVFFFFVGGVGWVIGLWEWNVMWWYEVGGEGVLRRE